MACHTRRKNIAKGLTMIPCLVQAVVLSDKPLISEDTEDLEPSLLEDLLRNIAMLASVYHKACPYERPMGP